VPAGLPRLKRRRAAALQKLRQINALPTARSVLDCGGPAPLWIDHRLKMKHQHDGDSVSIVFKAFNVFACGFAALRCISDLNRQAPNKTEAPTSFIARASNTRFFN
jgi:hypothetical protein